MNGTAISWILAGLLACALPGTVAAEPKSGGQGAAPGAEYGGGKALRSGGQRGGWHANLTDEQQTRLAALRVEYSKRKLPLKAQAKAVKAELAVLALAEEQDQNALSTKLDELVALQRELLQAKYSYISERRSVLDPEQRPGFDLAVLRKLDDGKARGRGEHHGGAHRSGMHGGGMHGGGMHGGGMHGGGMHGGGMHGGGMHGGGMHGGGMHGGGMHGGGMHGGGMGSAGGGDR